MGALVLVVPVLQPIALSSLGGVVWALVVVSFGYEAGWWCGVAIWLMVDESVACSISCWVGGLQWRLCCRWRLSPFCLCSCLSSSLHSCLSSCLCSCFGWLVPWLRLWWEQWVYQWVLCSCRLCVCHPQLVLLCRDWFPHYAFWLMVRLGHWLLPLPIEPCPWQVAVRDLVFGDLPSWFLSPGVLLWRGIPW